MRIMRVMDEQKIIQNIVSGDAEHYRLLVERYQTGLIIYIEKMVRNRSDAEDIAQDVFVKAYTKLGDFDAEKARFSTWLYRIAAHASIDFLRKHGRVRTKEEVAEYADMIPDVSLYDDEVEDIRKAVAELEPPKFAEIIRAYYWEGKSYQEIARQYETSTNTVGTWMHRAKQQLKEVLS